MEEQSTGKEGNQDITTADHRDDRDHRTGKSQGIKVNPVRHAKEDGYKDNIPDFMTYLFTQSKKLGMTPVWWDEGHYYNRGDGYFAYDDVGQVYAKLTGSKPNIPASAELVYTGIKTVTREMYLFPKLLLDALENSFVIRTVTPLKF